MPPLVVIIVIIIKIRVLALIFNIGLRFSVLIILSFVGAGHARDHLRNRGHGPLLRMNHNIDASSLMPETMMKNLLSQALSADTEA
jgi:hypothetical protein